MESNVTRTAEVKLELWIKDLGAFDPYQVFMDGVLVDLSFETEKHYEVPENTKKVVVQFTNADGGICAMVDNRPPPSLLVKHPLALNHTFTIVDG